MKSCLEISFDLFFWTTIQGSRRVKVEKLYSKGDYDKNWNLINLETAQNDEN
jgi:ABC-type lipoprotein release transport system permease subunit